MKDAIIEIIMGTIGSFGFGLSFNIKGKKLLFGCLGGTLAWTTYLIVKLISSSEFLSYFIAAIAITLFSEFLAVRLKTPTITTLVAALIPLVPGSSLYYTMEKALKSDYNGFISIGSQTLEIAVALSLGIVSVLSVFKHIQTTNYLYK